MSLFAPISTFRRCRETTKGIKLLNKPYKILSEETYYHYCTIAVKRTLTSAQMQEKEE